MFQPDKLKDLLAPAAPVAPVQDPFSLDALIAWLRTKDGATTYNHMSTDDCLICRFVSDRLGRKVGFSEALGPIWPHHDDVAGAAYSASTYAGALERAIAIKAGCAA